MADWQCCGAYCWLSFLSPSSYTQPSLSMNLGGELQACLVSGHRSCQSKSNLYAKPLQFETIIINGFSLKFTSSNIINVCPLLSYSPSYTQPSLSMNLGGELQACLVSGHRSCQSKSNLYAKPLQFETIIINGFSLKFTSSNIINVCPLLSYSPLAIKFGQKMFRNIGCEYLAC